jgi:hypothetical protein
MAFGPDRMLYVTIGDCTYPSAAPDPSHVLGKILRLGFTGKPAPGNPYGANNPVCAVGVRNPFGLCFDPVTGYGYFTDNGPLCDDEVNRLMLGVHYGWGSFDFCGGQPAGTYLPMISMTPTIGVTGCTVYRGATYPGYNGNLFMGSYTDGSVRRVVFHSYETTSELDSIEVWATVPYPETSILDVTAGTDGRIWFSTFDQIWRVLEPATTPVGVAPGPAPEEVLVSPNPSAGQVRFALNGASPFEDLDLVDVAGRQVRHWSGPLSGAIDWDGRDDAGHPLAAGVYWLRAGRGDRSITRCVVRVAH